MSTSLLRNIFALLLLATVSACSTTGEQADTAQAVVYPEPVFSAERILPADYQEVSAIYDPWEGMNRRIYNFNYHFDKYVFLPVVNGYEYVVPGFARTGVKNFFRNFADVTTMLNSILQLNPDKFFHSTGRVLVNSTFGLFGLVDVATKMDIPRPEEDFGQTLGYWGVGQGPYLMIPFLGPSNLRDGMGELPDFYALNTLEDELTSDEVNIVTVVTLPLDARANTSFRYYENGSAFEYDMVRWLWSTKRDLDIAK